MRTALKKYLPIAQGFAELLYPLAEVVIHDLKKDKIEAIFNSFSKRNVGDKSYLENWNSPSKLKNNIIGPYKKTNYDGRNLKSISIILRDETKKAISLLCINMDISIFDKYRSSLQLFLDNNDKFNSEEQQNLFKDDLYEQITVFIRNYCQQNHLNIDNLNRNEKQNLILTLKNKGAFDGKNATNYIARILNISRATVYNYLKPTK